MGMDQRSDHSLWPAGYTDLVLYCLSACLSSLQPTPLPVFHLSSSSSTLPVAPTAVANVLSFSIYLIAVTITITITIDILILILILIIITFHLITSLHLSTLLFPRPFKFQPFRNYHHSILA
jgi:hypothetical protein